MNNIQKILLLVGIMAFGFWFLYPSGITIHLVMGVIKGTPEYFFKYHSYWYKNWFQTLSLMISIGSLIGLYLFKDK